MVVGNEEAAGRLRDGLPPGTEVGWGEAPLVDAVGEGRIDVVLTAIVGAAGLRPAAAALAAGADLALANKEAMVAAGPLLRRLAAASGARLLPVDSEHAAIHQALRAGRPQEVRRLVLTASGGPVPRPRSRDARRRDAGRGGPLTRPGPWAPRSASIPRP